MLLKCSIKNRKCILYLSAVVMKGGELGGALLKLNKVKDSGALRLVVGCPEWLSGCLLGPTPVWVIVKLRPVVTMLGKGRPKRISCKDLAFLD